MSFASKSREISKAYGKISNWWEKQAGDWSFSVVVRKINAVNRNHTVRTHLERKNVVFVTYYTTHLSMIWVWSRGVGGGTLVFCEKCLRRDLNRVLNRPTNLGVVSPFALLIRVRIASAFFLLAVFSLLAAPNSPKRNSDKIEINSTICQSKIVTQLTFWPFFVETYRLKSQLSASSLPSFSWLFSFPHFLFSRFPFF